jgi:adenylylsulfate kinase-like enzyme
LGQNPLVRYIGGPAPPTGTPADFANPVWRAARDYDFRQFGGGLVHGWDNAVNGLEDVAAQEAGPDGPLNERRAVIITGPPATGKSTATKRIAPAYRAAVPDGDDAQMVMLEHNQGYPTDTLHPESMALTNEVIRRFIDRGTNLVLPKVGSYAPQIAALKERLEKAGYTVDLVHVQASPEISERRNIQRFYAKWTCICA